MKLMPDNFFIHSDNLTGLQYFLNNGLKGKIGLVCIDHPFVTYENFTITNGRTTNNQQF
jgi:hypothetical protein